jgi:hypothetical protein
MTNKNTLQYAIIQTLNGSYKLTTLDKAERGFNDIELELYDNKIEGIKKQFHDHIKLLKKEGFI